MKIYFGMINRSLKFFATKLARRKLIAMVAINRISLETELDEFANTKSKISLELKW